MEMSAPGYVVFSLHWMTCPHLSSSLQWITFIHFSPVTYHRLFIIWVKRWGIWGVIIFRMKSMIANAVYISVHGHTVDKHFFNLSGCFFLLCPSFFPSHCPPLSSTAPTPPRRTETGTRLWTWWRTGTPTSRTCWEETPRCWMPPRKAAWPGCRSYVAPTTLTVETRRDATQRLCTLQVTYIKKHQTKSCTHRHTLSKAHFADIKMKDNEAWGF